MVRRIASTSRIGTMSKRYTEEYTEWFVANYKELGPTQISRMVNKKVDAVEGYARVLRARYKSIGDERWRLLDSRGNCGERQRKAIEAAPLKNYTCDNLTMSNPYDGKYGICPPWLVITDPAFDKTLIRVKM